MVVDQPLYFTPSIDLINSRFESETLNFFLSSVTLVLIVLNIRGLAGKLYFYQSRTRFRWNSWLTGFTHVNIDDPLRSPLWLLRRYRYLNRWWDRQANSLGVGHLRVRLRILGLGGLASCVFIYCTVATEVILSACEEGDYSLRLKSSQALFTNVPSTSVCDPIPLRSRWGSMLSSALYCKNLKRGNGSFTPGESQLSVVVARQRTEGLLFASVSSGNEMIGHVIYVEWRRAELDDFSFRSNVDNFELKTLANISVTAIKSSDSECTGNCSIANNFELETPSNIDITEIKSSDSRSAENYFKFATPANIGDTAIKSSDLRYTENLSLYTNNDEWESFTVRFKNCRARLSVMNTILESHIRNAIVFEKVGKVETRIKVSKNGASTKTSMECPLSVRAHLPVFYGLIQLFFLFILSCAVNIFATLLEESMDSREIKQLNTLKLVCNDSGHVGFARREGDIVVNEYLEGSTLPGFEKVARGLASDVGSLMRHLPKCQVKVPRSFRLRSSLGASEEIEEKSFVHLIISLCEEQEIVLSEADLHLFDRLEGGENFKYGDCVSQMQLTGLCVEVPKGTKLPTPSPEAVVFKYGPEQRTVHFIPERLTAVGLSVLSWILVPGTLAKNPFLNVIKRVTFNNCFVRLLRGNESPFQPPTRGSGKYIVVPMGWLTVLGVSDAFLLEHGEYADMAAFLGASKGSTTETVSEKPRRLWKHILSTKPPRSWRNQVSGGTTDLYLNENYRLVFEVVPSRKFEVAGGSANVNAKVLGFEGTFQRSVEHYEARKRRTASHAVTFISISHFVRHHLQNCAECPLFRRMEWFRRVISDKCVFPSGEHIGFLKAFTGRSHRDPKACMFPDAKDCRVEKFVLVDFYNARQIVEHDRNSSFIFLDNKWDTWSNNELCTRESYGIRCKASGMDIWGVEGTFEKTAVPEHAVPLERDIG